MKSVLLTLREYWTCQDGTTDQCEKTTKALDFKADLKTAKRTVKAVTMLRTQTAGAFAAKVNLETSRAGAAR